MPVAPQTAQSPLQPTLCLNYIAAFPDFQDAAACVSVYYRLLRSSFPLLQSAIRCPTMAPLQTLSLQDPANANLAAGRGRFIIHRGKQVLSINYANCDVAMLKAVAAESHRAIALEPPHSVLTLN